MSRFINLSLFVYMYLCNLCYINSESNINLLCIRAIINSVRTNCFPNVTPDNFIKALIQGDTSNRSSSSSLY